MTAKTTEKPGKVREKAILDVVGEFQKGLNPRLRAVILFPAEQRRDAQGNLLGSSFNLTRVFATDGVAIGPGVALEAGLKAGDKVRVRLERV